MTLQQLKQEVIGAVARGYVYPHNSHKEMDTELVEAIAKEVNSLIDKYTKRARKMMK